MAARVTASGTAARTKASVANQVASCCAPVEGPPQSALSRIDPAGGGDGEADQEDDEERPGDSRPAASPMSGAGRDPWVSRVGALITNETPRG